MALNIPTRSPLDEILDFLVSSPLLSKSCPYSRQNPPKSDSAICWTPAGITRSRIWNGWSWTPPYSLNI